MHRVKAYEYPFTAAEFNDANDRWGANCGPGALAAMLGLKIDDVRSHIPKFDERRYTNPSMMQAALRSLGVPYREVDDGLDRESLEPGDVERAKFKQITNWPVYGLMRIQWEGPWCNPGVPPAAAYRYTHWIGVVKDERAMSGSFFFDINGGWFEPNYWAIEVVEPITKEIKRATGFWHPTHRWELELP